MCHFEHILPDVVEMGQQIAVIHPDQILAPLLEELEHHMAKKVEASGESFRAPARPAGYARDFPEIPGEKSDDPVRLPVVHGADNYGFCAMQRHEICGDLREEKGRLWFC